MKRTVYIIIAIGTFLTFSCTEHWNYDFENIKYGFNSEIHTYSKEFVIMKVNDHTTDIQLNGNIELYTGSVSVTVARPDGKIVFEKNISGNDQVALDEAFPAQKGYWKLKYQSNDGEGFIDLRLNQ